MAHMPQATMFFFIDLVLPHKQVVDTPLGPCESERVPALATRPVCLSVFT